jgi:hypothetical protein
VVLAMRSRQKRWAMRYARPAAWAGLEVALAGAAAITVVNRGERRGQELAELIRGRTPAAAHLVPWTGPYPVRASAADAAALRYRLF